MRGGNPQGGYWKKAVETLAETERRASEVSVKLWNPTTAYCHLSRQYCAGCTVPRLGLPDAAHGCLIPDAARRTLEKCGLSMPKRMRKEIESELQNMGVHHDPAG